MSRNLRRTGILALIPTLAVGLWIGRSMAQQATTTKGQQSPVQQPAGNLAQTRMGPNQLRYLGQYVKVGSNRINISQILFTKDDGKAMIINFGRGSELRLDEAEAEALRRWIDLGSGYPMDAP
jgi:hypothetical protein